MIKTYNTINSDKKVILHLKWKKEGQKNEYEIPKKFPPNVKVEAIMKELLNKEKGEFSFDRLFFIDSATVCALDIKSQPVGKKIQKNHVLVSDAKKKELEQIHFKKVQHSKDPNVRLMHVWGDLFNFEASNLENQERPNIKVTVMKEFIIFKVNDTIKYVKKNLKEIMDTVWRNDDGKNKDQPKQLSLDTK